MREYRGKASDEDSPQFGKWCFGNLVKNTKNGYCFIIGDCIDSNEEYFSPEWWEPVDPETVGQDTGLKDKNGTRVFEKDTDGIGIVVFKDGAFWYDVINSNETFLLREVCGSIEIVGTNFTII